MYKYYLRIEGVNLENFVYDTQDLNTIRGSGLALIAAIDAVEEFMKKFPGSKKISSGASIGMFEVDLEDSEIFEFCEGVKRLLNVNEIFRHATFAVNLRKAGDSFKDDREKLVAQNRWQQMQSPRLSIPTFVKTHKSVCEVDRVRPAKNGKEAIKNEGKYVSESVFRRRQYGKDQKRKFIKQELNGFGVSEEITGEFTRHFDALTSNPSKGNLHHKMALIYLDGNAFGKIQRDLAMKDLERFDEEKTNFHREWLARLMKTVISQDDWTNEDSQYQLEILLWGGDEICIVVPAWKGWKVVEQFYMQPTWGDDITHSLGMVFCHHNAPIRRVKNLAEELASLAKRKSRGSNLFCYEILKSFDHIGKDLDDHRKKRSAYGENAESLILDASIFSRGITGAVRDVKKTMPHRKLNQIVMKLLSPLTPTDDKPKREGEVSEILKNIDKDTVATIENCKDLFGGRNELFLHTQALWDFIEDAK